MVPIHEKFQDIVRKGPSVPLDKKRIDSEDPRESMVSVLDRMGCLTTNGLTKDLGYSVIIQRFRDCIQQLLTRGRRSYLYPDKPRYSKQKLCSTTVRMRDLG